MEFKYRYLQGTMDRDSTEYEYTFHAPWHQVEVGSIEANSPEHAADLLFSIHNRDDRPRGRYIRSMSTGDIIEFPEQKVSLRCSLVGWTETTLG